MTYINTVSPDFEPDRIAGWFVFNTWLQRATGLPLHLELYGDYPSQHADIRTGRVDLIYANPADAALLVRERHFSGVARPRNLSDEAVVVVAANGGARRLEDLRPDARIAATPHPEVRLIGMMLLASADIGQATASVVACDTATLVAKALIAGKADVGLLSKAGFEGFSEIVRKSLRVLVASRVQLVRHGLLVGPRLLPQKQRIAEALLAMAGSDKGRDALRELGIEAWDRLDDVELEFMIDLVGTLRLAA